MKGKLKWPLIIAAVVVVFRVATERLGAPESLNNLLSVAALHTLIIPIYLAIQIAKSGIARPYAQLFKLIAIYAVLVRVMVLPTYWLARIFEWEQPRFFGTWGPDVGPIEGVLAVPLITAAFWILASVVGGGIVGSIVLAVLARNQVASRV